MSFKIPRMSEKITDLASLVENLENKILATNSNGRVNVGEFIDMSMAAPRYVKERIINTAHDDIDSFKLGMGLAEDYVREAISQYINSIKMGIELPIVNLGERVNNIRNLAQRKKESVRESLSKKVSNLRKKKKQLSEIPRKLYGGFSEFSTNAMQTASNFAQSTEETVYKSMIQSLIPEEDRVGYTDVLKYELGEVSSRLGVRKDHLAKLIRKNPQVSAALVAGVLLSTAGFLKYDDLIKSNIETVTKTYTSIFPSLKLTDDTIILDGCVVTAYNSVPEQTDDTPCITANGFDVCAHGIEDTVANNKLPFGTRIKFPEIFGDKVYVVRDRMNQRYGGKNFDIWMKSITDAKKFKYEPTKVEILKN